MRQILRRHFYFSLAEAAREEPIPPGKWVNLEAELVLRLQSTRRGRAAWWKSGEQVPSEALGSAPYQPMLRALISGFEWYPPGHYRWEEYVAPDILCQGGSEVLNFAARIKGVIPDPLKGVFGELISHLPGEEKWEKQGRLMVCSLGSPPWKEEEIPESNPHRWFFNHLICGASRFAWRALNNGEAIGIALLEEGAVILSPDHQGDFLRPKGRWCILRHPLPRRGSD